MYAKLRPDKGISAKDVVIPVDTKPGYVAQVDAGSVGKFWDLLSKAVRKAHVFVLVLGFA